MLLRLHRRRNSLRLPARRLRDGVLDVLEESVMALLGFKDRFVPKIAAGEKTHTIRERRKIPIKTGETLHLYQRPRQKGMKLILRAPCVRVEEIAIGAGYGVGAVFIGGEQLNDSECEQLARRDGFTDFREMLSFWDGRLPFLGQIIHWDFSKRIIR